MNTEDFEKRLQRVPPRKIPSEWRNQILESAMPSRHSPPSTRHSFLSTISHQLSTILWPNPKAWAGLAAVWVLIFALHLAGRESTPAMAAMPRARFSETAMTLKEQQKILAELIDSNEPRDTDKARRDPAQPHTERRRSTSMA